MDEIQEKILAAAHKALDKYGPEGGVIKAIYEHDQWWVTFYDWSVDGWRTFSVNEAEGIGTFDGFDFEEV